MKDPEIQYIMKDPQFMNLLNKLQEDPNNPET